MIGHRGRKGCVRSCRDCRRPSGAAQGDLLLRSKPARSGSSSRGGLEGVSRGSRGGLEGVQRGFVGQV
eukprot:452129-Pyramimonas_sp.AAC.1